METVDFTCIEDALLRKNIQHLRHDIIRLTALLPHAKESKSKGLENCIRKTIIIYTASILEALLRWHIQKHLGSGKITLKNKWKQKNLYTLPPQRKDSGHRIVLMEETREQKDSEKLDFNRMIHLCKEENLLNNDLLNDLDEIRKLRNSLHIGGLVAVTKTYSQKKMDFVLNQVKETMQAMQ